MSISENINIIKNEIGAKSKLIAVSKRKPTTAVIEAYNAGQKDFGENYIQELLEKKDECPEDINWHFIGHLQRNKVKYIAPFIHLVHAVDSVRLLKEINKEAAKNNRKISVLLQVHIAQEESKFGFDVEEIEKLVLRDKAPEIYEHVEICGLMAMASNTDNTKKIEQEFYSVKCLFEKLHEVYPNIKELSIGMSKDYKLALNYRSTFIRLGTAIFGERS